MHRFAVTTHREFVISHLKPWLRLSKEIMSSPQFIGPHLLLNLDQIDIIATGAIEQLDPEWIRLKRIVLEQNQDRRPTKGGGNSNLTPTKVNIGQEDIEMTGTETVEQTSRSDGSSPKANFADQQSLNGSGKQPGRTGISTSTKKAEGSSKPRGRPPKDPLKEINLLCEAMEKLHPERVEDFLAGTLPKWLQELTAKESEAGGENPRDSEKVPQWFIDCLSEMDEETLQRMETDLGR